MAGLLEYTKNGQVTEPPLYRFMRGNVQSFLNSIPDPSGLTREEQLNLAANVTPTMGLLGTFIGKGSKLWNSKTNDVAKALEKEGVAPETIWSQTGNVKAPDGKWRQEIPDYTSTTGLLEKGKSYKLPEGLKHEELYKAYPELQNVAVSLKNKPDNVSYFAPELNQIKIGAYSNESNLPSFIKNAMRQKEEDAVYAKAKELDAKKLLTPEMENKMSQELKDIDLKYANLNTNAFYPNQKVALHETQHAIQGLEGFARGGSPETAAFSDVLPKLEDVRNKIKELDIDPYRIQNNIASGYNVPKETLDKYNKWQNLKEQEDKLISNRMKPYDAYKRLFGEAEARLTENRIPLTQEQRLQYYPYAQGQYGLDVPYGELIVQGLLK